MKRILVGLLIIITLFITACEKPTYEKNFYDVQQTYNEMESYSATTMITVYGNKSEKQYKEKHVFEKPNKYFVEVIEPTESKGCITIHDGKMTWLKHPEIEQSVIIKNSENMIQRDMFFGDFLEILVTTEKLIISSEKIDGNDYLTLFTEIPENNKYRYSEKIWINTKGFAPYKLVIFDKDGNINTKILYTDFEKDVKIDTEVFRIQ